ncbi:hypothetical protein F4818DRAFT_384440 [Hypoxylon cercidicola]|nr:hypothetical protein F4818DRAFT_384440 [Hypoxylon cercidicola]
MNTVVGVTQELDEWSDGNSSWILPMFSPFGEGMSLPDSQFWGDPNSPQTTREELAQCFDTTSNFDSGYAIDPIASLEPGTGSSGLIFDHQQHAATKPAGQPVHSQSFNNFPFSGFKRPYGSNGHDISTDEEVLCGDSPATSTTIAPSKRLSPSPDTKSSYHSSPSAVSPVGSASGNWITDKTADWPSPASATADTPTGIPKNRRNRERNRVAAHKCRQKAKQSTSVLQERERELGSQNRILHEHADSLRDEILDLKNEILKHSHCDSEVIQSYIARAARDLH